jgi:hypothetical protein
MFSLAGRASAAALLVAAGAGLGALLRQPTNPAAGVASRPETGSSQSPAPGASPSPSTSTRPSGVGQFPPPPRSDPPTQFRHVKGTKPTLIMLQPMGDGYTGFVIHGVNFPPGARVTITLVGIGPSRVKEVVDPKGTFNYTIDQGHVFFAGPIPLGLYHVIASVPDGKRAEATFNVIPAPGAGPPVG